MRTRPARQVDAKCGAGVYKVSCRECDQVYIVKAERDFKVRVGEHKSAVTRTRDGEERSLPARERKTRFAHYIGKIFNYLSFGLRNKPLGCRVNSNLENPRFNNTHGVVSIDSMSSTNIPNSFPQFKD